MHALADNPELLRAQELGLKIWSFPEYIYEQSRDKKRIVIGGSHGKTTVTSMIMHVLWYNHLQFDYMVGSQLEGFETMVQLTADAPVIILEGDEYLSSPIDPRPKFHLYHPHIAVITGIAWDHMNVFPTFENYLEQFDIFAQSIPTGGSLFWYAGDPHLERISNDCSCKTTAYESYPYTTENGKTFLVNGDTKVPVPVFGRHNMENIAAAWHVCCELGITQGMFYEAISSFRGAAKRQQLLTEAAGKKVYLDFAHAPSKVRATMESFRETYPGKKITAYLELHTFSSLNKAFMPQYAGTMDAADRAIVYYNPEVVKHKQLPEIEKSFVSNCFQHKNLQVIADAKELKSTLLTTKDADVCLLMSSGNFSGLDLTEIAQSLTSQS